MSTHKKKEPPSLFNKDDFSYWKKEWKDMPEFKMKELNSEYGIQKQKLKPMLINYI